MQVPVNPMDYKKLVRKTIGVIVGTLVIFAIGITLVIVVLQPIIWVTNMLGRISEICNSQSWNNSPQIVHL